MNHAENNANSLGHEPLETDVRAVWRTAAVIVAVVIGSGVLIIGMMKWFAASASGPPMNQETRSDPNWDDQNPLQRLRNREHDWTHEYEWVDPAAGVARIPVDRAMEIVSQTGLPAALPATGASNSTQQPASAADNRPAPEGNRP